MPRFNVDRNLKSGNDNVPISLSTEGDLIGKTWKFESVHYQNHFIHRTSNNQVTHALIGRNKRNSDSNSLWHIVLGLCGRGISFKSRKHPDLYIRRENNGVYTHVYKESEQMKEDACFLVKRGSGDEYALSFESVSTPNQYLKCASNDFIEASSVINPWDLPEENKKLWKPVIVE